MDTPEKIYLIDMGDEVVWCEDRQPDAHIDDEDVAEYTLTSVSQAEIDLITDRCATSIKKADAEIDKLKDLIRLRDKYIKELQAEIDAMQERFDTVVKDVREQAYINGKHARQAEIDELVDMLEIGANWMREWLAQGLCECEHGHICGKNERTSELKNMDALIAKHR